MRRQLLVAAGVGALVLAIPLALLGRAVLATPAAVARETAVPPADVRAGTHHRSLADRAAWKLLGADRVEPFAEIVRTYRTVTDLPALAGQPTWSVRLARLIPRLRSPEERAQAYVMAGTLLGLAAGDGLGIPGGTDSPGAKALLRQAADDFRFALQNDEANEQAKYDLELLLKQDGVQRPPPNGQKRKTKTRPRPSGGKIRKKVNLTQSRINDAGIYATGSGY